ncbi:hypothetical protein T01_7562 [Trichinella spiralis]|uniref:Uncharacterized protein n=1 Tax=Trichinella spiralis TaxID=6334 RepID=A0A0V1BEW0_TRISP|nr:hypothetical protein T01_7562 [Trichinella spiralis]
MVVVVVIGLRPNSKSTSATTKHTANFRSNDWIGRFRQRAWPNPELSLVNACYPVPRDEAPGGSRSTCCCQSRCPKIFMPQLVPEQGFRKTGFNEAPNFSRVPLDSFFLLNKHVKNVLVHRIFPSTPGCLLRRNDYELASLLAIASAR